MKLSTLIVLYKMFSFYFYKVCKETGLPVGKNLEWTEWTLNFVFAIIIVLGIIFGIWIISGKDEKKVEKVQETEKKIKMGRVKVEKYRDR